MNPITRMVIASRLSLSLVLVLTGSALARGQGTKADYERSDALGGWAASKVQRVEVRPQWSPNGDRFLYRRDLGNGVREFVLVPVADGVRKPAFDHADLAAKLAKESGKEATTERLPIERILLDDEGVVRFLAFDQGWKYDPRDGSLSKVDQAEIPAPQQRSRRRRGGEDRPPRFANRGQESPDGKWSVAIKDHNLILKAKDSADETVLTTDGMDRDAYEPAVFWAPDSSRFVALKTNAGEEHIVHFIESSPGPGEQPKLHSFPYHKPGDKIPTSKPHLFEVATKAEIPVRDELFSNPWSVGEFRWSADSSRFSFLYNQRGHQVLRLVEIDAKTGATRPVIDEVSKTFIDYAGKSYLRPIPECQEILWMSERNGWNHLYVYNEMTGLVKNAVTSGDWVVRSVDRVDVTKRQVWFTASGIVAGQDPYYKHACRVNFDGTGLVILTEADGTHEVEFSPDRRYLIDTYSRVDLAPVTELRDANTGKKILELERADDSELRKAGWQVPERFVSKARDGVTDIHGVIFRPTQYDPTKRYPVVEDIYAGPQDSFVPKNYGPVHGSQAMAELGFIVVKIDGLGTSNRSKAFHDVCWKNLGDAGLPDRILWMKAAAEKDPAMDLTRVGVYGGSAGGQNALGALLEHGDFYKVAVSDCGCHDNRMDKIWWNELWMGWPVGPHYDAQSNVTNAHKLKGKLLLMVGEMDRNVDPASTMQVVNALVKADKDFELLVVPGGGHGGGGKYTQRRRRDFLVRNLLGVEPRSE